MQELQAGIEDGAVENMYQFIQQKVILYMLKQEKLNIQCLQNIGLNWISLKTDQGIQRKYLKPGEKPAIDFKLCDNETVEEVYAYCNLHGLWKA